MRSLTLTLAGCAADRDAPAGDAAAELHPLLKLPITGPVLAQKGQKVDPYRTRYEFMRDAFTFNIPVWEKALAPYAGCEGLRYLEEGLFEGRRGELGARARLELCLARWVAREAHRGGRDEPQLP